MSHLLLFLCTGIVPFQRFLSFRTVDPLGLQLIFTWRSLDIHLFPVAQKYPKVRTSHLLRRFKAANPGYLGVCGNSTSQSPNEVMSILPVLCPKISGNPGPHIRMPILPGANECLMSPYSVKLVCLNISLKDRRRCLLASV